MNLSWQEGLEEASKRMSAPKEKPKEQIKNYNVNGATERIMIKSLYNLYELDKLVKRTGLSGLVSRIEPIGESYYQIDMVKKPVLVRGDETQRNVLELLGQVVASANGLHWSLEKKEDTGYY